MKILFLTNKVPFPPKDGGSIASLAMINSFARAGHETTVLAMNTRKHHFTPCEIPDEIKNRTIVHMVEVPAPISMFGALRNFFFSSLPYNAERFINQNFKHNLELLLDSHEYNIIQLEGLYLIPYIPTIRKFSKSKIAYRSHNIEHEIWLRIANNAKGIKKIYLQNLSKRLLAFETSAIDQYDLLLPITSRDEHQLNLLGNSKPSLVIPAGIDHAPQSDIVNDFKMNLFCIGALDWAPNQEGLRWFIDRCFPSVTEQFPGIRLKIAGRNAPDWFIELLEHPQIDFMGEIDDASEFIRKNGILIVPLLSGSGMRVKIIEGMSNSKAIVTTSVGCEGINAENGKHIFIADNPIEFSKYIVTLLNDKDLILRTGKNAAEFVYQNYNNKVLNEQLVAFYNQHLK
jgi:glycosyltransferase involved in cell wall biosynthesis